MSIHDRGERKTCFIAMPITTPTSYVEKYGDKDHFLHVLDHLFRPALEQLEFTVVPPSVLGTEVIHAEIIKNLEQANLVLCDLSSLNPNVFFELGIRTSLDRALVLVKDDLTSQIPFDLNAINTLTYDGSLTPWSAVKDVPRLVDHIRSVAEKDSQGNAMWRYFGLTKRGAPSDPGANPVEAKLDLLIDELTTHRLSPAMQAKLSSDLRPASDASDLMQQVSEILRADGISAFSTQGAWGKELRITIPNRQVSQRARRLLADLGDANEISIEIE